MVCLLALADMQAEARGGLLQHAALPAVTWSTHRSAAISPSTTPTASQPL